MSRRSSRTPESRQPARISRASPLDARPAQVLHAESGALTASEATRRGRPALLERHMDTRLVLTLDQQCSLFTFSVVSFLNFIKGYNHRRLVTMDTVVLLDYTVLNVSFAFASFLSPNINK